MKEFHKTLQELRKQHGLTQEELAQKLFVSRTAVSKWESGRGFPNIDSLKAIAACFSVTLDELLSGEEILEIAEEDHKEKASATRDLVFGLLDCGMMLLLFLPFFGQSANGTAQDVSLLSLTTVQPYLKTAFLLFVCVAALLGIAALALQNRRLPFWTTGKSAVSLIWSAVGVALFIVSRQPYAAIFTFVFLVIKAIPLLKHR